MYFNNIQDVDRTPKEIKISDTKISAREAQAIYNAIYSARLAIGVAYLDEVALLQARYMVKSESERKVKQAHKIAQEAIQDADKENERIAKREEMLNVSSGKNVTNVLSLFAQS